VKQQLQFLWRTRLQRQAFLSGNQHDVSTTVRRPGQYAHMCRQPKSNRHVNWLHQNHCDWHNNKLEARKARRRCLSTRGARPLATPPLEHEEEASASSLGSLYLVMEVDALSWSYGGHPMVTGGYPTLQFWVNINKKLAGLAVPDTGASWTVIP
jgi:hypothetical protein